MSDLRTFTVEIETQDDKAEYDLQFALKMLTEIVTRDVPKGRVTIKVTEGDQKLYTFERNTNVPKDTIARLAR